MTSCGPIEVDAHVDLASGRVVVDGYYPDLKDEEIAMVTRADVDANPSPSIRVTRIAVGATTMCVTGA